MNRLSLRNKWLKFKTAGKLPIILEEFMEYTPIYWRKTGGCPTCNRLDLQTLTRISTDYNAQKSPWSLLLLPWNFSWHSPKTSTVFSHHIQQSRQSDTVTSQDKCSQNFNVQHGDKFDVIIPCSNKLVQTKFPLQWGWFMRGRHTD